MVKFHSQEFGLKNVPNIAALGINRLEFGTVLVLIAFDKLEVSK